MDLMKQLAVQSYCFRNFKDNKEVVKLLGKCGLKAIELCGVHVDFKNEKTFDDVIAVYRDAGIAIVSIGVNGFSNTPDAERKLFAFAAKAGCKVMSVDFKIDTVPACYRTAEKLADEYNINLAIHNHGGRHWLGSAAVLANVFANTSPRIGLCLDTAWALHSHEEPVATAEKFKDRLYGVHLKDFTFDRAGKHKDVVVGTGNLDLPALSKVLESADFSGPAIIEYEGDVENPAPAVKKCVKAVEAL